MPRLRHLPLRKIVNWLHLWLGIALCLPFMLQGLTGSILVYGDDLDRLFGTVPQAHVVGEMQPPAAILAAGQKALPPGFTANRLTMPAQPGEAAILRAGGKSRAEAQQIYLDPVSLEVLAIRGTQDGWLRFVHNLHANLLLEGRPGRATIGWLGTVLLVMTISGFYLWWPRNGKWRQAITIKRGAKDYRLQRDLHGMAGFWTLPLLLLMTVSGLSMCFPQTIGEGIRAILPGRDLREAVTTTKVAVPPGMPGMPLDQVIALAQPVASGRRFAVAYLPLKPEQPWRLAFAKAGEGTDLPPVTVLVDPYRGDLLEVQDPARYTAGEGLLVWLRPLHYGLAAGPLYQALICLTGLSLPLFAVTGITMWWLKGRAKQRSRQPGPSRDSTKTPSSPRAAARRENAAPALSPRDQPSQAE
jgi:uncharacterized iron-regulated membrane protein